MPTCAACHAQILSGGYCPGPQAVECRNRELKRIARWPTARPTTEALFCLRCGHNTPHRIDGNRRFCTECERERGPAVAMVTPAPAPAQQPAAAPTEAAAPSPAAIEAARADRDEYAPKPDAMPSEQTMREAKHAAAEAELGDIDAVVTRLEADPFRTLPSEYIEPMLTGAGYDPDHVRAALERARAAKTPGANGGSSDDHAPDQPDPARVENGGDPSGSRLRPWEAPADANDADPRSSLTDAELAHLFEQTLRGELPPHTMVRVFATLVEVPQLRARIKEQQRELGGDLPTDELHPNGRCRCAGEGKCLWCARSRIKELEAEVEQYRATQRDDNEYCEDVARQHADELVRVSRAFANEVKALEEETKKVNERLKALCAAIDTLHVIDPPYSGSQNSSIVGLTTLTKLRDARKAVDLADEVPRG